MRRRRPSRRDTESRLAKLEQQVGTDDESVYRQLPRVLQWIETGDLSASSPGTIRAALHAATRVLRGAQALPSTPEQVTLGHLQRALERGSMYSYLSAKANEPDPLPAGWQKEFASQVRDMAEQYPDPPPPPRPPGPPPDYRFL